ncbi:hypothetical protein DPMN_047989 [Dreissena polymorpha]|uniref:Uncharacterized protein n=1 Tax=Dreissena polymorpha TaxID=45954 RepID=A0A9D4DAR6_DREPO|nr:hypothetical protein DPMN_047989 [Dreissena polymorpha]
MYDDLIPRSEATSSNTRELSGKVDHRPTDSMASLTRNSRLLRDSMARRSVKIFL